MDTIVLNVILYSMLLMLLLVTQNHVTDALGIWLIVGAVGLLADWVL